MIFFLTEIPDILYIILKCLSHWIECHKLHVIWWRNEWVMAKTTNVTSMGLCYTLQWLPIHGFFNLRVRKHIIHHFKENLMLNPTSQTTCDFMKKWVRYSSFNTSIPWNHDIFPNRDTRHIIHHSKALFTVNWMPQTTCNLMEKWMSYGQHKEKWPESGCAPLCLYHLLIFNHHVVSDYLVSPATVNFSSCFNTTQDCSYTGFDPLLSITPANWSVSALDLWAW